MKLLIVGQHFYPENFRFNDLALGLKELGHEVTVLTGVPNYPEGNYYPGYKAFFPFKEIWNGITIIRAPLIPRKQSKWMLALNYLSFPITSSLIGLFIPSQDAVLVCQSSPIFMAFPANFRRFFRRERTLLWITDLWPESLRATNTISNFYVLKFVEFFVRFVYRNVDEILISCRGFEKSIKDKDIKTPIKYFPYWAESFYRPVESETRKIGTQNEMIVMFAGNIGSAQGLNVLVEAANIIRDPGVRFVIIGAGRGESELKELISKYRLEESFTFLGSFPATDMPAFFAQSDVLFLSLRKDPIFEITVPSKIQSYMACGKPILASIDGETASLIEESKCGVAVPAGSAPKLAKALAYLKGLTPVERNNLGANAFAYCELHFKRANLLDFIDKRLSEK